MTKSNDELRAKLDAVEAAKARLDAAQPLPAEVAAAVHRQLLCDLLYNSLALSGSSLTESEVDQVLRDNDAGK